MSNKLQLTLTALNETKTLNELAEMPAVRQNAIQNIVNTQGLSPERAAMYYERERILFVGIKNISDCDKFSQYTAWIQLLVSGGSLNDGDSYIIKMGKQAVFIPGWKARLRMMGEIPEIINIPPPQVVGENDDFEYELGETPRVIKHKPSKGERGKLTHVYLILEKKSGKELHIMDRQQVLAIRDKYSKSYIQYVADCAYAKEEIGATFKKNMGSWEATVEPPMWISSEHAAWKKTIVKRAWDAQQNKSAKMRKLPVVTPEMEDEVEDISYGVVDDAGHDVKPMDDGKNVMIGNNETAIPKVDLGNVQDAF